MFNHDGECFAYYELLPYNYSFLSPEQKYQVHDSFRQLIAQNRDGKIHALQISTESSIRAAQERSKQEVTGRLKDVACAKIDAQTEAVRLEPNAHPLFHSDRGFQYTSAQFYTRLKEHHMKQSMSRVAHCIDNGPMEGFWGILKREMYYRQHFNDRKFRLKIETEQL